MKRILALAAIAVCVCGCSMRKRAMQSLGETLSARLSESFASDNDPELVRDAVPFSLKLVESLLAENPRDEALLTAAAKGYTQYAFAFVQMDADETEDRARAQALRERAAKLYLRARDYGLRGLEVRHPGFAASLKADPAGTVRMLTARDVPPAYWTGVAWAGALAVSRNMFMLPEIPQFEALMERTLALDESFNNGSIHSFFIAFEMNSPTRSGEKAERARKHFERAVELSRGLAAAPYVTYAETVAAPGKNRLEFERLLNTALKIDLDKAPGERLQNLLFQRKARTLLRRTGQLFR